MKTNKPLPILLAALVAALASPPTAHAQGSAFTYQGYLENGGSPADGAHNFVFTLKDAASGGSDVGTAVSQNGLAVDDGVFTASLDFGADAFSGGNRWLEISVDGTTLTPRQPVQSAPYATFAGGIPNVYSIAGNWLEIAPDTGSTRIQIEPTNGINFRGGGARVSHALRGPSEDWYIRSGSPTGIVALQDGGGNVGIGTTNPAAALSITGANAGLVTVPGVHIGGSSIELVGPDTSSATWIDFKGQNAGHADFGGRLIYRSNLDSWNFEGGNVGIGTTSPTDRLTVAGNVKCTTAIITSDREKKDGFEPVDPREVLDKVAAMPITKWHYKTDTGVEHIGPVAQDFHAAFGVGADNKHIATVDADGIALAAIKGLKQQLDERDAAIEALETRLRALEERSAK